MPGMTETLDAPFAAPLAQASGAVLERVSDAVWEETVADFDDVSQEQLITFARARWPRVALEPLLISSGGSVIGACLVMIQRLPLGVAEIAVAKWGPFLRSVEGDALGRYGLMVEALIEDYARKRRMMLSLLPLPALGDHNAQFELLVGRGFHRGAQMPWNDRYIVKLHPDAEAQRKSFGQNWRRKLGKAEKAGLRFERAGAERLGEFDALYRGMIDRKGFEDRSAYEETVPALMAMPNATLRPELFLVSKDGMMVAGAIIFKAGDRAVYLYGATSDAALPLQAGYFMHWHIIGWLRQHTPARWYDLGGTDGFQGLHQFKRGMVGETGLIVPVPPSANYATYRLPFVLGEAAFAARDVVQRLKSRLRERGRRTAEAAE